MTEGQREAPDRPEAERYYAQHASLEAGESGSSEAALQEAINEGARQSWKLVGVTQDPTSGGVILVWDTSGFFSGSRGGSYMGASRSAPTGKSRHQGLS
jgi:hypothetical protein